MLGGDDGALNYEYVEAGLYSGPVVALDPLRSEAGSGNNALVLYLLDAAEDELLLYGLHVDLLHHARGLLLRQARYLLEDRRGVLVARLDPLEVEDGETTQGTDDARRSGVNGGVERGRQAWQVQLQVSKRPGDVYVLRVAGPAARDDSYLVEAVRSPTRLAFAYLNIHTL